MKTFNENGFKCKQSVRDPCLFSITCPEGEVTHMICYTDDCDCHTTSMASVLKIAAKFETRFGIKVVKPEFMLGVKRKRYHREGVLYVHLSQEEYIAELYESFKIHMSDQRRSQSLPLPKLYQKANDYMSDVKSLKTAKSRLTLTKDTCVSAALYYGPRETLCQALLMLSASSVR